MRHPSPPSSAERSHFAAIARAKAEEKRDQIERAARDDTAEGIVVGLELSRLSTLSPEIQVQERARAAAQIGLRLRWLALQGKAGLAG